MEMPLILPERRHEVWHESDRGDWRIAYFDVPLPTRFEATAFRERVEKSFKETVEKWAAMLAAENEVPVTMPFLNPNVFYPPEPDRQDYRRFYIAARVKKTRPDLYPLDTVAALRSVQVDQNQVTREFFGQMEDGFQVGKANEAAVQEQAQGLKELQ